MNRVLFEGRFLINMINTLLQRGTLQVRYARMDWERIFRLADYNRVANIVYLGILGNGGRVPERWMNRFFDRYQEALQYGDSCEAAEREILALADMGKIPCVVLSSTTIRRLYDPSELADTSPLRLYLSPEGYEQLKGYLVDLGYETTWNYPEYGEHMSRISGFGVDIYHKLPFRTRFYEKGMRELSIRARIREGGETVRTLSADDRFVFRMASMAYRYVTNELLIREMLDLLLYHRAWRNYINEAYVKKKLQEFRVDGLADKLLRLAYMWFGGKEDKEYVQSLGQLEDTGAFDILESRIVSRGDDGKDMDPQVLGLVRLMEKEDERERRKIKRQSLKRKFSEARAVIGRRIRWAFPEYKYMCALYPILEKAAVLLPLFWLLRGMRLLAGMIKNGDQQP